MNPPYIKKNFPVVKGGKTRTKFDSADYFLEMYWRNEDVKD